MPQVKHEEIAKRGIRAVNTVNMPLQMNPSGILPTEYNVVVQPKAIEEKTAGGIYLPDQTKERDQFATQEGILIALSEHAFSYEGSWSGEKPKVGDRVLYAKYCGFAHKGRDGVDYRVIKDKDICAVLT